jgi:hypothetical protein
MAGRHVCLPAFQRGRIDNVAARNTGNHLRLYLLGGVLLFWCQAEKAYNSIFFRIKVIALILAGVNILYFHLKTQRSQANWDTAGIPPTNARLAGLFSILLWAIIIAAGRLMAYTF